MFSVLGAVFLCSFAVVARHVVRDEPVCPKFYYEEKTLEKLVRLEHKVELQEQDMQQRKSTLENTLAKIEDEKQTISAMVEKLGSMVAETETTMTEKASEWDQTFKNKLDSHELIVQSFLASYKMPTVLFKAKQASRTDIATGRALVFTEAIINLGDGYDVTTGHFTAPVSGTYMFTSQLCSKDSQWAHAQIIANEVIVESTSHHGTDGDGTCMTFTGVAVLSKGQRAWVQGSWDNGNALFENPHRWNNFGGILINTVW